MGFRPKLLLSAVLTATLSTVALAWEALPDTPPIPTDNPRYARIWCISGG